MTNFSVLQRPGYMFGHCHIPWATCSFFDLPGFTDTQFAEGGGSDQDVLRE
jgi:hypothetical protein